MLTRLRRFFSDFFNEQFFHSPGRERLNRWLNWRTLFLFSTVLFAVALIIDYDPSYRGDTSTYIKASYKLAHGEIDLYRTPLLPFLILCFRTVFGEAGLTMLCVFQQLLFLLTVMLLRHTFSIAGIGRRTSVILTVFYLFIPYLLCWWYMAYILTETVSFFLFMVLGWLSVRTIVKPASLKIRDALWITLLLFLLIADRPGNLYLLALYTIVWLIVCFSPRWRVAAGLVGLAGIIAVSAAVWEYRNAIRSRYGYDGITVISYVNNYHFVRQYGLMKPEYVDNPELRQALHELNAYSDEHRYDNYLTYFEEFGPLKAIDSCSVEMQQVVNKSIVADPASTGRALTGRLRADVSSDLLTINQNRWIYVALVPYMPNMGCVYLFLLICLIGMIVAWVRRHRFPWLMAYLWGMVFASHITAMLGAMADWDRLTYGSFPFLLLMFAMALRFFISCVRTINRPVAEHCSTAV